MEITIFIAVVLVVWFFVNMSSGGSKLIEDENENRLNSILSKDGFEVYELVKKVKTPANFRSLENKYLRFGDNMKDDYTGKCDDKIKILYNAYCLAGDNPFKYYYWEEYQIHTPLKELEYIGKLIDEEDYNTLDDKLRVKFEVITVGEVENIKEAKEIVDDNINKENLKELLKLRKIIDSDLENKEKKREYNAIVSKNEKLINLFLFQCDDYFQQLKDIEKLKNGKSYLVLNSFDKFINAGYTNLDSILKEDEKKLIEIKGIGKKIIEEIQELNHA